MDEGAYFPSPMEAPIMAKGYPDLALMETWHKGRKDAMQKTYSGGNDKANFAIMPHELLIGLRDQKANYTNDPAGQLGITAVPGAAQNANIEQEMERYYFIGVPTDEHYYQGESMYNTDSLDHGFGVQIAGKCTIINTCDSDITPGDYVAWRLPATEAGDPGSDKYKNDRFAIDTGLNPITSRNRMGTPFAKPVVQLEKFNPLDFTFQLSGAFWALNHPESEGGVNDVTFEFYEKHANDGKLSQVQQEAFCWGVGLRLIALHAIPSANQEAIAKTMGLLENDGGKKAGVMTDDALTFIKSVFGRNVVPGDNDDYKDRKGDWNSITPKDKVNYLLDNTLFFLTGGISKAMMLKLSRVIGKAASSAAPSKSLDVVLVGARIGI